MSNPLNSLKLRMGLVGGLNGGILNGNGAGLVGGGGDGPKKIKISDLRKIEAATGRPISDKNRRDVSADPTLLEKIVRGAIKNGIDPYTALAIAHQETSFAMPQQQQQSGSAYGKIDPYKLVNPFQVGGKAQFNDGSYPAEWMAKNNGNSIDVFYPLYKEKLDLAKRIGKKDEASIIQAWNGYGKLPAGYYGMDTPIDMNQNPVYGRSVIDLRENVLKKNPEIISLVDRIINSNKQPTSKLAIMNAPALINKK